MQNVPGLIWEFFSIAIQATSGHTEKWNGPQFSHMLQIAFIINDQHFNFCTLIVAIKPNDILFGYTMEHIPELRLIHFRLTVY